jgi:hypothetical protein
MEASVTAGSARLAAGALALAAVLCAGLGHAQAGQLFATSDRCIACHNGVVTRAGEDVSIGFAWRPTMMANAARDPYWQAAVRRETLEHPSAAPAIEDECSRCHMPMANVQERAAGGKGQLFAHLPPGKSTQTTDLLAADGVSCSTCHQIRPDRLGTKDSFVGGFVIDTRTAWGQRPAFGPFAVDAGRSRVMRSSARMVPTPGPQIQSSELCATCHTLITEALDASGRVVGRLPEQVPYQEWLHSEFRGTKSCQSCHMRVIDEPVAVSSVLGQPRPAMRRHEFRGGNFLVTQILGLEAGDLGVAALPQELSHATALARQHLTTEAASIEVSCAPIANGTLTAEVVVNNLGGHKLPTAYPSRRAWLHVTVRDRLGRAVFESGRLEPRGSIAGNENDSDPGRFEPHHATITRADQVQIYEAIIANRAGLVTTGLLNATQYVKDNRLLPRGFDKATAEADVAVHGDASADADFAAGGDRVAYAVDVAHAEGPLRIEAELMYQPIGFRWAENLRSVRSTETARFVSYYQQVAGSSAVVLARAAAAIAPDPAIQRSAAASPTP